MFQVDPIFHSVMNAVSLDPHTLENSAKLVLKGIDQTRLVSDENLLLKSGDELGKIFAGVPNNPAFRYTDSWGVGLVRMMELRGSLAVDKNNAQFAKWSELLCGAVCAEQLAQSWGGFIAQQRRMQEQLARTKHSVGNKGHSRRDDENSMEYTFTL